MKKIYFLSFCFLILIKLCQAQQGPVKSISVNFQQATIEQFVTELEAKSGFHFFYDAMQFDSLKVTMQATNKPIETILSQAFKNTGFSFAITKQQQVFLTKGREIQTGLAVGYFGITTANATAANMSVSPANADLDKDKKIPEATTENKLYEIGIKTNTIEAGTATLSGYVKEAKSGESVTGASIYVTNTKTGVATDQFGYFTIKLPKGRQVLSVRGIGMRDTRRQIMLYSDGKIIIEMQEQVTSLKEVKISAEKVANVRNVQLGVNRLDIKSIKQVPTVFGEADILRVVLTLPGVQSVGEATTGFNVRGGSADQNLILMNDATIYNPSHFFGFFSSFNPDIVKDIELYKSSIPERFGGRLSSVLDVTNREGNKKKFTGSAGIGLITSRLNVEGPIIKNKTSFSFGGRTTYSDWLLKLLPDAYKHSSASFYDLNLDISHQIDDKNNLYLTSYISKDKFRLNSDTAYSYSNRNINLKWKHNFNNKLFSVITAGIDKYQYDVSSADNPVNAYKLNFDINQSNFKTDFTYYLNRKNTVDFGLSSIYYKLHPGNFQPLGAQSLVAPDVIATQQALESALYLGDKFDVTDDLSISGGVRYSIYNFLGPQTVYNYAPNLPKTSANLLDSTYYASGKFIKTYSGPEIRLSARYQLGDNLSIKGGYNTLRQYIHLLSNTTAISPTDVWQLSDPNIKPQYGDQVSLGLYHNLKSNTIETSVEVYYKRLRDYLDYKSGANLVLNHHIETDVVGTQGKAYGIEFLVKKATGKANGWISYTYSRTFLRQNDPNAGDLINGGAYYPANFDKPHAFNFISNYRFSHRFSVSLNLTYSTGRPITLPIAKYEYGGSERVFYSDRNQYRIPDYFRSDFSMNIEGNHKVHQLTHNSFTIGVYNLTGRQNAYSTFFTEQGGAINGYKLSIFAKPIPFINYNIRF
ncbi:TonB-dependent receptor plug domain-containing protein [Mucilaginibacter rubeus]|uniref:TonB-dependent receptor n=1 Tax=Mucilaginibacter rubeus TaxID=2027860 RepID=A0AAE6JI81_9SPHI|nr:MULTISPECIES: TonB-dependent receptor [Mucilaginibacter]QEM06249.1 TonB-dependent receptor plug domain-containing protein [Mucilaginibacter rubeus]QEM18832.1 TonB-dependent receptor plug domain-containing protein [Mucilaginibacter gossypii]QTE44626.1 TonB-dependent receptor [Mucilaginibacter rubeus]QTE51224.1 TonB-dependent receptor [Mucilaginibacter rubeus]QTE56311.1 TonB-dependent receptor [Mucilaginibacter rubeus]